ncbi:hypothetical protein ILUMI_10984 [Ignelater luminosus]|uniref:HEAT repeat-containing protein 6 n=1 Tax=Ignelater luminosus TaxID=2038154 RepID=A0A8K0GD42_IGNLU|nr:hypothetical protein ILUMI_10984 [Ignelater luminosus]
MSVEDDRINVFNNLSSKFSQLMYGRTEGDRIQINKLLDEINYLDYRYPVVNNATKAVLLVHQCCTVIPQDDSQLVSKCCQLIINLINRQHVQIEGQTLTLAVQWCLQVVKLAHGMVTVEILWALDALLRSNPQQSHVLLITLISNSPIVLLAQKENSPEILLASVQCLEACTGIPDILKYKTKPLNVSIQLETCANIFLKYLTIDKVSNFDDLLYCKLLASCIRGLQNIIIQNPEYLHKQLGILLGTSKTYMVFGIKGINFISPQKITPSILNVAEPSTNVVKEKKGGKIAKQRKHRTTTQNKKDAKRSDTLDEVIIDRQNCGYIPATSTFDINSDSFVNQVQPGNRLKTSDSDFSDTEAGRIAKLGVMQGRVRQAALNLLLHIIKLTDKHTIFCYWSSLIPEGSPTNIHNLITCILKDPSPKGRMAALNALLTLLTSSKLYLSQAESSEKYTAYTPFSVILGSTIKDLHKNLILALNENSIPVLTQVLKCLAALVQATPYHRLTPGIISKVIRSIKVYIKHRDATVKVAALIVLGCVLASEPVLPETKEALLKQIKKPDVNVEKEKIKEVGNNLLDQEQEIEYVDYSSEEEEALQQSHNHVMPWLLEQCLLNLGINSTGDKIAENVPAPVKLESLQVISAMTRNYFDCLMIPHIGLITKALDLCLSEKYADLRLHAGRTVDFVGQAINQHLSTLDSKVLTVEQGFLFWQTLINSKSLTSLLQCEQHPVLRAVSCDCLGSIGPHIFEHFQRDKQIVIITLLFACSRDDENSVKAAAVRALAICVLYPSLREDSGFVVDVAETIHQTLQDENMTVRIKASWSLGNLSDALVLNQSATDMEEFPNSLLLRLLQMTIKIANDNDKIRVNAVRALGNLLQLITREFINQTNFKDVVEKGIDALVKNATVGTNMKVRWNSCYAIGNILKNSSLYLSNDNKKNVLFNSLMELVMSFRNFKVRINAAVALSCPTNREMYGQHFFEIWTSLLKALENTQNVEDFSEYNHRDHLVEQICISVGHMITLLTIEDLTHIHSSIILYLDIFKLQMHRVLERVVPEKSSILLVASNHLNELKSTTNLTLEQKETLQILHDVFTNDLYL